MVEGRAVGRRGGEEEGLGREGRWSRKRDGDDDSSREGGVDIHG